MRFINFIINNAINVVNLLQNLIEIQNFIQIIIYKK